MKKYSQKPHKAVFVITVKNARNKEKIDEIYNLVKMTKELSEIVLGMMRIR